jgi:dTMP kinase
LTARAGASDAIESRLLSYHEAVHRGFLEIARANPQRCVVLDASAEPQKLADAAMSVIEARLGGAR